MTDYLLQSTLYLISALCCTLVAFLHFLFGWGELRSHQDTHGWRLSLAWPLFPSQISFDELNSAVMSTEFSILPHTFWNCLAI